MWFLIFRRIFTDKTLKEKLEKYIGFFVYLSHSILSHSIRISKISRVEPMRERLSHSLLSHSIHPPVYHELYLRKDKKCWYGGVSHLKGQQLPKSWPKFNNFRIKLKLKNFKFEKPHENLSPEEKEILRVKLKTEIRELFF